MIFYPTFFLLSNQLNLIQLTFFFLVQLLTFYYLNELQIVR